MISLARKDCIETALGWLFEAHGRAVARWRLLTILCIAIPVVLSACLSIGFKNLKIQSNIEYLFTPTDGPAKAERATHRRLFPFNESHGYYPSRRSSLDGYVEIIVRPRNGSTVLNSVVINAARRLDDRVKRITVLGHNGTRLRYADVCGRQGDRCVPHAALAVNLTSAAGLRWPVHDGQFIGMSFGDVSVQNHTLRHAGLLRLSYYTLTSEAFRETADTWLENVKNEMLSFTSEAIEVFVFTSKSREQELDRASGDVILYFVVTYTILTTFTIMSSLSLNWVVAKPWLAFTGVLSAGLAVLSCFGLLLLCGVQFTSQIATTPFLIIGVGVDDVFVIMDGWRQAKCTKETERKCQNLYDNMTTRNDARLVDYEVAKLRVCDRMSQTMRRSAVSITITSLTNVLVFLIGTITTFRSVQLFCAYAGLGIVFCYIYAITFFAGFVVLFGLREETGRHCYSWCVVVRDIPEEKHDTCWYKGFCDAGLGDTSLLTTFFRDWFSRFVASLPGRITVTCLYAIFLATSAWGITRLKQGLDLRNLANDDSYVARYITQENKFASYALPVNVMLTDNLAYSKPATQEKILQLRDTITALPYMTNFTESWLDSYLQFRQNLPPAMRPENEANFTDILTNVFLKLSGTEQFRYDINTRDIPRGISSSRFIAYSRSIKTEEQADFLRKIRQTVASSELAADVYYPAFIYYDQYLVILPNTLQNLGIAVACMFVIALLIIPGWVGPVMVTLSVISIEVGVIGFMAHWGVSLDTISMINVILCIGFSVDFSCHITYHYMSEELTDPRKRVDSALGHIGFPIVQGCLSTVLGVIVLLFSLSYIFRAFSKTMILVMLFGTFHALCVLPAVYHTIDSLKRKCRKVDTEVKHAVPMENLGFVHGVRQ